MKKEELIKFAVRGIDAEIDEREKIINQGNQYLLQILRGQKVKIQLDPQEIRKIIKTKEEEIEMLSRKKFSLKWELIDND